MQVIFNTMATSLLMASYLMLSKLRHFYVCYVLKIPLSLIFTNIIFGSAWNASNANSSHHTYSYMFISEVPCKILLFFAWVISAISNILYRTPTYWSFSSVSWYFCIYIYSIVMAFRHSLISLVTMNSKDTTIQNLLQMNFMKTFFFKYQWTLLSIFIFLGSSTPRYTLTILSKLWSVLWILLISRGMYSFSWS
jgi:hypothetical protein